MPSFADYTTQHHPPLTTLLGLLSPWTFLLTSLTYLPGTLLSSPSSLLSWSRLHSLWFSRFWHSIGPQVQTSTSPFVIPLLSGLVHRGVVVPPSSAQHPGLGGTVLEIGAGSGLWASLFSDEHLPPAGPTVGTLGVRTPISHIYGVEPNPAVHAALRERVAAAGLGGRYEIVPVGIEDLLATGRVAAESVDCIVSVLCLCSIPEPARNIRELYKCLKPGGRWYVFEHVKAFPEQGRVLSWYQGESFLIWVLLGWGWWLTCLGTAFINLFWPICIGGCNIRRDTVNYLLEAGEWSDIDLRQPPQEPWYVST
jgi:SAM-dependent methyltransferase